METLEQIKGIFDSHAHYDDDAFNDDRAEVLEMLRENGVCNVINIGCDIPSSEFAAEFSETYDWFYASAGIHPGNADQWNEKTAEELEKILSRPKMVAVGEIGLDYHYRDDNKEEQKKAFREQMAIAEKLNLPVIIHSREATADTLEILREFPANGVVHCFSGSAETAEELVKLGYHIGFTGVVSFSNAQKTKRAAQAVPMDRLLLETDAPYMAPVPFRGKRCTSDLIRYTAQEIARLKELPVQEVVDRARENTKRLFGIKD